MAKNTLSFYIKSNEFKHYLNNCKKPDEDAMMGFIIKNKVSFIIYSKNVKISNKLKNYFNQKIEIFKGDTVLFAKNNL